MITDRAFIAEEEERRSKSKRLKDSSNDRLKNSSIFTF